jgi:hypothetical protein
MLVAARSSQDFASCERATASARSKCASAFAASHLADLGEQRARISRVLSPPSIAVRIRAGARENALCSAAHHFAE